MILKSKMVAASNKRADRPYLPIQSDDLGTKTYVFGIESTISRIEWSYKNIISV
jgi:hypothetical protein